MRWANPRWSRNIAKESSLPNTRKPSGWTFWRSEYGEWLIVCWTSAGGDNETGKHLWNVLASPVQPGHSRADWSTSMSRSVQRSCCRQQSYVIKNQLGHPKPLEVACSSLVLYGIRAPIIEPLRALKPPILNSYGLCHKKPASRGLWMPELVLYGTRELAPVSLRAP